MGKILDITNKLTNERPLIKIAEDKIYEVDNSKNTVLKINQTLQNNDKDEIELIDFAIKTLMGKEAFNEIEKMDLDMKGYKAIFIAIMAAVSDEEYEVVEQRFQKSINE